MNLDNAILIGQGALNWDGKERRSDRYGTVAVCDTNSREEVIAHGSFLKLDIIENYETAHGKLVAKIIETRDSTHIGDLFRGLSPSTPNVGDLIELGEGQLFSHRYTWADAVGLIPSKDGITADRRHDWLNPSALYRCHEQTVELYFIPS